MLRKLMAPAGAAMILGGCAAVVGAGGTLNGEWGGTHVALSVADSGAVVQFDCAHGSIEEPLRPGPGGALDARGRFVHEHGGPVREGEVLPEEPARYTGRVAGGAMTLTVTLTTSGQDVGTFGLRRGAPPTLFRCL